MAKEEEIAEFIGIMLGDGSIGIYDCKFQDKIKKQYQLKVTLDSRNKEYISYVHNLMTAVLGVSPKTYLKKNENTADIRIFRREVVLSVLEDIGLKLSPKWDTMEIPKDYTEGKLGLLVLKGLFDTDGSVTIFDNNGPYPRIEIRVCPCPAQSQLIGILEKSGFNYKIQRLERGKIKIRLSGKEQIKRWFDVIGSSNKSHIDRAKPFL